MKIAILLFDENHFCQVLPWLKKRNTIKEEIILIPLDAYSLRKAKECGYNYMYPEYKLKEQTRNILFRELPKKMQEWAKSTIDNEQNIRDYLFLNNIDFWDIIKNRMCIRLFDKLYFVELVRDILLKVSPNQLIIPLLPSKISLCYLTIINRKTIVDLAESLGITVIGSRLGVSILLQYIIGYTLNFIKHISLIFKIAKQRIIYKKILNKNKKVAKAEYAVNQKKKKILAWGYFPDFDPSVFITILAALKSKNYDCKLIINKYCGNNILDLAEKNNLPTSLVNNYREGISKFPIFKMVALYYKKWFILKRLQRTKKIFCYHNISLWDNGDDSIAFFLNPLRVADIFKDYELVKYILQLEKPDLLMFPEDQKIMGKICAKVAKEQGITCLCIPNAVDNLYEHIPILDLLEYGKYAVGGEGCCELLKRQGLNIKNVVVTGLSLYDINFKIFSTSDIKDGIYKTLNLDKNKGIFLFTMQEDLPENKEVLRIIITAMKNFPNKYLIIRPHPIGLERDYTSYIKKFGLKNITVTKRFNFWDIAYVSEIVLTIFSLTGFEAMLLDKPVITINLTCFPDFMPYVRYGAALGVYKEEELILTINKVLYDSLTKERLKEGRKKIIEDYAYKLNGKAAERIANLAEQLICDSKSQTRGSFINNIESSLMPSR